MKGIYEFPVMSATALDDTLRSRGKFALAKYRQDLGKVLDQGTQFSVGRGGTIRLASIAALDCLATAGRWDLSDARRLAEKYKAAGLDRLLQSRKYSETLKKLRELLKERTRATGVLKRKPVQALVAECLTDLTSRVAEVREVTIAMGEISAEVDMQVKELKRIPGRLVRIEGNEALVTVKNDKGTEELRTVDSTYLKSFGITESGSPFVLHELSWSPDSTSFVFFPALDLELAEEDLSQLEKKLRESVHSLPTPAGEEARKVEVAQTAKAGAHS